MNNYKT